MEWGEVFLGPSASIHVVIGIRCNKESRHGNDVKRRNGSLHFTTCAWTKQLSMPKPRNLIVPGSCNFEPVLPSHLFSTSNCKIVISAKFDTASEVLVPNYEDTDFLWCHRFYDYNIYTVETNGVFDASPMPICPTFGPQFFECNCPTLQSRCELSPIHLK